MDKSSLANRMKKYEGIPRIFLTPRMPLILRIDGKAFHTYTRGFDKPWDNAIMNAMSIAAKALVEEIQGSKLAYIQSDEISVLVNDYEYFETQAWFDKNLQKVVSVSASVATAYFNKYMWSDKLTKEVENDNFQCCKRNQKQFQVHCSYHCPYPQRPFKDAYWLSDTQNCRYFPPHFYRQYCSIYSWMLKRSIGLLTLISFYVPPPQAVQMVTC